MANFDYLQTFSGSDFDAEARRLLGDTAYETLLGRRASREEIVRNIKEKDRLSVEKHATKLRSPSGKMLAAGPDN